MMSKLVSPHKIYEQLLIQYTETLHVGILIFVLCTTCIICCLYLAGTDNCLVHAHVHVHVHVRTNCYVRNVM